MELLIANDKIGSWSSGGSIGSRSSSVNSSRKSRIFSVIAIASS